MKSTKNSYKNTENEKEKAMTTDQVWPVGHFFADDQAAKEARKQVLLKEAEKKAKEVSELLNDKWEKAIAPEKVIAPESDEDQNNAGENESKTQPASIEDELYHMAERYVLGLKSRYWRIDGKYYSVFDTREVKLIIERTINPESFDTPNNLVSINHALRACLKQGLVPAALQPKDKEKFEQLINLFEKKKNGLTDPYGHVVTEVASSSVMGQFFSKVVQVSKKESIGEKKLDPSIGKELREIAKQCEYTPLSHIQFWELESPTSDVILDRKIPALYPVGDRYVIYASSDDIYIEDDDECQKWIEEKTKGIKGFKFEIPTSRELKTSFQSGYHAYNPYMDELYGRICMASTGEAYKYWNDTNISKISEKLWVKIRDSEDGSYAVIPICRLKEGVENDFSDSLTKSLLLCLEHGLVPKSMESSTKSRFRELIAQYKETKVKDLTSVLNKASKAPAPAPKPVKPDYEDILAKLKTGTYTDNDAKFQRLKDYISQKDGKLSFDLDKFMEDVREGRFKKTVNDYEYDIEAKLNSGKVSPEKQAEISLLEADQNRADITAYPAEWLTSRKRGLWELYDQLTEKVDHRKKVSLSDGQTWMARPPQMDVKNGICAIDFGTKSTTVVCRDEKGERLLRIGTGNLLSKVSKGNFENPTAVEFRDVESFKTAYDARDGRPFTRWADMTVSQAAVDAMFDDDSGEMAYYSVFNELKQWANDPGRQVDMTDRKGHNFKIMPYDQLKEGDLDPIEIYAYYLGLYINNMYNGIYLDYTMSFPVNYSEKVSGKIRESFEKGLKKSLPLSIRHDDSAMSHFRVQKGCSEPAAYAIKALEKYGLEPKEPDQGVAYGVFDFGGGTTDFDYGFEKIAKRHYKYEITHFNAGGDDHLGGENLLALMAYQVFRDNLEIMRENQIHIVLPFETDKFTGGEVLVEERSMASAAACLNMRILQKTLRPLWEGTAGKETFNKPLSVNLYPTGGQSKKTVQLTVRAESLMNEVEKRISKGVDQFFEGLWSAFESGLIKDNNISSLHIFMAGNASKSPKVKKLMNQKITKLKDRMIEESGESLNLQLWLPLGMEGQVPGPSSSAHDHEINGKTGVAFGLLRCSKGTTDIHIKDLNQDQSGQTVFPYYLGINRGNKFSVIIKKKDSGYMEWQQFWDAMEDEVQLFYTTDNRALAPDKLPVTDPKVKMVTLHLTSKEVSEDEDVWIYIRKTGIDTLEYVVAKESDMDPNAGKEPDPSAIHKVKLTSR